VADIIQDKGKVCFTIEEFDAIDVKTMTKERLKNLYRVKKKFMGRIIET